MTPKELYKLLDEAGVDYEIIEIFEGVRLLSFKLTEEEK
jgi:hypothetical protein